MNLRQHLDIFMPRVTLHPKHGVSLDDCLDAARQMAMYSGYIVVVDVFGTKHAVEPDGEITMYREVSHAPSPPALGVNVRPMRQLRGGA